VAKEFLSLGGGASPRAGMASEEHFYGGRKFCWKPGPGVKRFSTQNQKSSASAG